MNTSYPDFFLKFLSKSGVFWDSIIISFLMGLDHFRAATDSIFDGSTFKSPLLYSGLVKFQYLRKILKHFIIEKVRKHVLLVICNFLCLWRDWGMMEMRRLQAADHTLVFAEGKRRRRKNVKVCFFTIKGGGWPKQSINYMF